MQVHPHIVAAGAITATHTGLSILNNKEYVIATSAEPRSGAVALFSATSMATFLLSMYSLYNLDIAPQRAKHLGHWLFGAALTGLCLGIAKGTGNNVTKLVTGRPLSNQRITSLFKATLHDSLKVTFGVFIGTLALPYGKHLETYLQINK